MQGGSGEKTPLYAARISRALKQQEHIYESVANSSSCRADKPVPSGFVKLSSHLRPEEYRYAAVSAPASKRNLLSETDAHSLDSQITNGIGSQRAGTLHDVPLVEPDPRLPESQRGPHTDLRKHQSDHSKTEADVKSAYPAFRRRHVAGLRSIRGEEPAIHQPAVTWCDSPKRLQSYEQQQGEPHVMMEILIRA